jgi:predicted MFS family arabinose efflux permease
MALAAPVVLPHIEPSRRGLASGAIFTGVGLGIAASGTLVPLLMHAGLAQTWFGLGAVALLVTAISWTGWPREELPKIHQPSAPPRLRSDLVALYVEYGLNAVGLVPHMIFLVDFVARGLGRGLVTGAQYWVLFGIGAMLGPLASGRLADRIGFAPALRCAFAVQAGLVALLVFSASPLSLGISSIVVGAMVPGVVPLVLGRVHELIPHDVDQQRKAWGLCTTAFRARASDRGLRLLLHLCPHRGELSRAVHAGRRGTRYVPPDRPVDGPAAYQAASSRVRMTAGPSILRGFV